MLFRSLSSTAPLTDPNTPPHPNFEVPRAGGLATGIVKPVLGDDGKPVYNDDVDKTRSCTTNAEDFYSWYHDSKYSKVVVDNLVFNATTAGTFVYDHSANCSRGTCTTPPFFPLDDRGWAAPGGPEVPYLGLCTDDNQKHNFYFTSELRYWFEYMGNEKLDFIGDDDVWVFVNGHLAVDIGGVHKATQGSVTLNAAAATAYGLTRHQIYEIVVFQAERRLTQSSYKLTIGQFNRTRTVCTPTCGDGIVNGDLELHLREEVHHVLRTAVELGVALLAPEALDLGDRDALHADGAQGLAHLVKLERLDNGSD